MKWQPYEGLQCQPECTLRGARCHIRSPQGRTVDCGVRRAASAMQEAFHPFGLMEKLSIKLPLTRTWLLSIFPISCWTRPGWCRGINGAISALCERAADGGSSGLGSRGKDCAFRKQKRQPAWVGVLFDTVLGGPGRNRTTDTRIFKTRLCRSRQSDTCGIS